jgi:hypothetical protein
MGIRVPKNTITTGKYTIGKEYVLLSSHLPYQGYYYELNNKTFAGKEFNSDAPEIIKVTSNKFNSLLNNPNIRTYISLSKLKPNSTRVKSIPFIPTPEDLSKNVIVRYFVKNLNNTPIIKEVTKDNFDELKSNSLYQTLKVNFRYNLSDKELNDLDKIMPGLGAYLASDEPNTSSDESNENLIF